jgi:transcriptional regulator
MELTATKEKFVELRAKGWSFDKIAKELGKAKQTLIDWSKDLQDEIANRKALELEALYETYYLLKEAKIKKYGSILSKITNELESRDFKSVPTGRLLELYLLYFERLSQEVIEPTFKSSKEITEEIEDRKLLEELTTINPAQTVRRLKVG